MAKYLVPTVLLLVTAAGWGVWRWMPATFAIRNESGKPICVLTVNVAGKTLRYNNVPAGGTATGSFHVKQEETLSVRGRFADGTAFEEHCGYVVWEEFAPHISAVVRNDGSIGSP
ncbi:unnamed protein product [Gemmata massiliana]|uniref:Uncharacterized protein n=1 Tax=Gemmata massiliana TaxID=1210884 RepID=A0A6P2CVV4_9BACT|nr:unnamed protein product [Gemmata massiliana]